MEMKVGETSQITCSPDFAYGASGFPAWGIPGNAEVGGGVDGWDAALLNCEEMGNGAMEGTGGWGCLR